ncbi:hypothetical protein GCM10010978_10690 [Compostibacillus humi]|jgi:spore germination protein PB|uniref:Spore germination protein PB n=1 Tax=Compostibacillus humi TaxID=1245525 RepID=A0A8J2ZS21_9BACI|nr:spore germination protein GerPB [Compostibacillus humi]GGH73127.1 hypothetical protein GCM10010978_10690 [Compostibacillus humi]
MNITVHQTIQIHLFKIGSVTNSSFVQIGASGTIQAQADIQNSGGFTKPAQEAVASGAAAPPIIPLLPT